MPSPATFTVSSGSERVVVYPETSRTSSGGSASVHSPTSVSSQSLSGSDSWSEVEGPYEGEDDGIEPSDSASRSRQPARPQRSSRRHTTEAPSVPPAPRVAPRTTRPPLEREEPSRRRSSHRHHSSRSRRSPEFRRAPSSDESASTVANGDDYPYGHYGAPLPRGYPPQSGYRHVPAPGPPPGHGGYPPSLTPSNQGGYPDPYAPPPHHAQALVHMQQHPPPHQPDPFGYPSASSSNPFSPQGAQQNPFSPMGSNTGSSYFSTDPHAPPMGPPQHHRPTGPQRPQSFAAPNSHYGGSELMAHYHPGPPSMSGVSGMSGMGPPGPYGGYPGMGGMHPGMWGSHSHSPMPGMQGWYPPPQQASPPPAPIKEEPKDDAARLELEKLKAQIQKEKDDAIQQEELAKLKSEIMKEKEEAAVKEKEGKQQEWESMKALLQKREEALLAREVEMQKKAEAEAAEAAAAKQKAEAEAKRKAEIDKATSEAKEAAEKAAEAAAKAAAEEHDKKLKEMQAAADEAEKKRKELEEEAAKNKPAPDTLKAPIRFKDAVGRKFSFPFHICKTWKGMETLIKQAFMHVDGLGEHVHAGHYDLMGPDGEILLPQVWDTMIQPDWEISMHMWPMEEPAPPEPPKGPDALNFAALGLADLPPPPPPPPGKHGKKPAKDPGKKKKHSGDDHAHPMAVPMPPPPPPGGMPMPPPPPPVGYQPGSAADPVMFVEDKKAKPRSKSKGGKELPPLATWFAGGGGMRPAKKEDEKLGLSARTGSAGVGVGEEVVNVVAAGHHGGEGKRRSAVNGGVESEGEQGCVVM